MDVGEVDLDDRVADGFDGVGDGTAGVGVGAGVEQSPFDLADALVQELDDLALARAVVDRELEIQRARASFSRSSSMSARELVP